MKRTLFLYGALAISLVVGVGYLYVSESELVEPLFSDISSSLSASVSNIYSDHTELDSREPDEPVMEFATLPAYDANFLKQKAPAKLIAYEGGRSASAITLTGAQAGATKKNAVSNAANGTYYIESQRDAYYIISAGVIKKDKKLLNSGLLALEWGYKQMAADGSFPGERGDDDKPIKYQHIHPTSFFVDATARSIGIIQNSDVDQEYKDRAEALIPKLAKAVDYMNDDVNLENFFKNAVDTNMLTTVVSAFQQTAILTRDSQLEAKAKTLAEKVLARQLPDGTFPEKGGFDSSYQMVSLEYMTRYGALVSDAAWKKTVMNAVDAGYKKELTHVNKKGEIDDSKNTRTEACGEPNTEKGPKGKDADIIPVRLYYYGYLTNQYMEYAEPAREIQKTGQGFDHIGC